MKYHVPALVRTISILELISKSGGEYTATEIYKKLNLPKATTFSILGTLEDYNMVQRDSESKFEIGPKLFKLGMNFTLKHNIVDLAKPHMKKLMKETGFTVHLGILYEDHVMYIAKEEPNSFIRFSTYPGMETEIHLSALGKAVSAYLSESELNKIIKNVGLNKATDNTITSIKEFKESLKQVRSKGYSIEDEEGEIGIRCISAPIINARYPTPIAISVTAHISELKKENYKEIGELIRSTAQEISAIF